MNAKRVYRLYKEEGLVMRQKVPRRRVACQKREVRPTASRKNERWSMDFVSDQLFDDRRFRVLTLVDNHTRECLALHAAPRIRGIDVAQVVERVAAEHGSPEAIQVDNGPEFISRDLDLWAYCNQVKLDFSRPGKPTDNGGITPEAQRRVMAWPPPGFGSRGRLWDDCSASTRSGQAWLG